MFSSDTTQVADGGYQISRSLRFNSADSAYLNRTFASNPNRKTMTFSVWVKRSALSGIRNLFTSRGSPTVTRGEISFESDQLTVGDNNGSAWVIDLYSTPVFRDPSAWYHVVVAIDTTQTTSTDRVKVYVNNVIQTMTGTYPSQNLDTDFLISTATSYIGTVDATVRFFDGYMTEVNVIDGQALTPSSFGETNAQTGVWTPKAYSGSYGTNGFYLNFSDNSNTTAATLGKDYSGNGNNWTPNNFSVTAGAGNDSLVDSPTSYGTDTGVGGTVRGNYCTWNPLGSVLGAGSATNGNLDVACADSTTSAAGSRGTIAPTSDKWYFEVLVASGGTYSMIGVSDANKVITSAGWGSVNAWTYYGNTGYKYGNGTDTAYGATYTTGDLIGVAYDSDAGTLTFYKNGTSQGQAFTGLTGKALTPYVGTASGTMTFTLNAGQRPFAYTAPSGYKALCTQNLPTPTIGATTATQAGKYFNTILYTGTGTTQSITGVGFQPDFVWLKDRTTAYDNALFDSVRGASGGYYYKLRSNRTDSETALSQGQYGAVKTIDSDGYTLGSSDTVFGQSNASGDNYVAWNWKANGSGSTNTAGSITSTVSANTTSGFSVVKWNGTGANATIGHGLGVAPKMVIRKYTNDTDSWYTYHASLGTDKYVAINETSAAATSTSIWQNTAPTSTVFSIGSGNNNSNSIAYCFAPVAGYSAFGQYTGNGSSDGPFVYTGFRPAYLLVKRSDAAYDWWVFDSKRLGYNVTSARLSPDLSDAEYTTGSIVDFTSNGFKIRDASQGWNGSGGTIIYMAFAEVPLKFSLAR